MSKKSPVRDNIIRTLWELKSATSREVSDALQHGHHAIQVTLSSSKKAGFTEVNADHVWNLTKKGEQYAKDLGLRNRPTVNPTEPDPMPPVSPRLETFTHLGFDANGQTLVQSNETHRIFGLQEMYLVPATTWHKINVLSEMEQPTPKAPRKPKTTKRTKTRKSTKPRRAPKEPVSSGDANPWATTVDAIRGEVTKG